MALASRRYRVERDGSAVRTHATALWAEAQARGRLLVYFRR